MNEQTRPLTKVAFLGDYLPRKCGIATFTRDLRDAVATQFPSVECPVAAVTDPGGDYDYPQEVRFEIREEQLSDYRRAAEYLQFQDVECVCVQHEYGIYGGEQGSHLLALLRELNLPVVTTCHTLLERPSPAQRRVMEELGELSQKLVAMSERGRRILAEVYGVAEEKLALIPHGIPDMPFVDPAFYKDQFGVEGKNVLLTFGLISPGKGLEHAIEAMPQVIRRHPDTVYLILGATHPHLVRQEGEAYRYRLQKMARDLGVSRHVLFIDRFVELEELKEFIGACDIYLTPYLNPEQITSGTLAYTYGCGKAVVSTPYWHAQELLSEGRGRLVPFRDSAAIAEVVIGLLEDDVGRAQVRKQAYLAGREMVWSRIAQKYMDVFREARQTEKRTVRLNLMQEQKLEQLQLPELRLDHLRRMTDSTGIFQHAVFTFPNFAEGYCLDDNARALVLTSRIEDLRKEAATVGELARIYAAFVHHSYDEERRRFRNFMSFDRRWVEKEGSEDSQGRALWGLGSCVGKSRQRALQNWAAQLFERSLPGILDTTSPRAWAFALIGIHEYLSRMGGERSARSIRSELASRLMDLYGQASSERWRWYEGILAYDNAKLPHALIQAGWATGDEEMLDAGLEALRWLAEAQSDERGEFAPVGSDGFYPQGGTKARFDQQPLEAQATVSACLQAYQVTKDAFWLEQALRAFRWFHGANHLGAEVYDHETGGCRDGLHVDRPNQNEGAESTLSYLLTLVELKEQEHVLSAFLEPVALDLGRARRERGVEGAEPGARSA